MYRLETKTNQINTLDVPWEKEEIRAPLATSEGLVYVHTQKDEKLYALDLVNNKRPWKLTLSSK
jgi:outer membrane protein assembly factor BamB